MVTIKIQSRGDIIGAYLQTLGFDREKAAEVSDGLSGLIDGDLNNGDEIIAALDELLLLTARKIWPLSEYSSEQLTALFKLLYLNNDGAGRWGTLVFSDKEIPEDMHRIMNIICSRLPIMPMPRCRHRKSNRQFPRAGCTGCCI